MPVQIVPQQSLATGLGQAAGQGLSSALEGLAQSKVKDLQAKKFEEAGLPGVLANLDPQVQAAYLKQLGAAQQQAQLEQSKEIGSQEFMKQLQGQSLGDPQEQPDNDVEPTFEPQSPGAKGASQLEKAESELQKTDLPATKKEEIIKKFEERNEKLQKQQEKVDKQNEGWLSKMSESYEGSQEADLRLDEMEKLISSGKLPNPALATVAESIESGIPIPFTKSRIGLNLKGLLYNPKGQKYDKLVADFSKNASKFFPRVTEGQVKQFMKSIPQLVQSDEGKLEVMQVLRMFNGVNKLRYETAQDLIEKNKGYQPPNLQAKVDKIVSPQIKRLESEFKKKTKELIKESRKKAGPKPPSFLEIAGGRVV